VHLAIPQKSLFAREREEPTASVLLKLVKGRTLSHSQVQGIVHFVSSSVEGLNPKNVSIIDDSGELLTQKADDIVGLSSSQLEYQHKYEKMLETKVMDMLEPVAGKGKVKVKVSANIDFSRIEKTEERFDPDSQVIRSEQKNTEKSAPAGTGGVPGVASNIPGRATQIISSQGQSEKKNETINYEISKVTSHVISPSGEIKRLSAAVIVDGTYAAQSGSKEKKYTPRSAEDIKYYEEIVKNAIGYIADRGDEVKVTNIPFESEPVEEIQEGIKDYLPAIIKIAKYFTPLLAMVLFFIFVLRPLMKTLATPMAPQPKPESISSQIQIQGELNEYEKIDFSRDKLIEWAKQNPNKAADMIRTWIEEK
jgi:flagellar M-ring protein FliF